MVTMDLPRQISTISWTPIGVQTTVMMTAVTIITRIFTRAIDLHLGSITAQIFTNQGHTTCQRGDRPAIPGFTFR